MTYQIPVRFTDKNQKNDAKLLAKKANNSFNGLVLSFIDEQREVNKDWLNEHRGKKSSSIARKKAL